MVALQSTRIDRAGPLYIGTFLAVVVLVGFVVFSGGLLALVERWHRQEEYSHGFLIPFVVAWMLWSRRDAIIASVGKPSWIGPVIIFFSAVMLFVGELSAFLSSDATRFYRGASGHHSELRGNFSTQGDVHSNCISCVRYSTSVLYRF